MIRPPLLVVCLLSAPACFLASEPFQAPAPSEAPALEARIRADSGDVDAIARLAVLHLTEGRAREARSLLEDADRRSPGDPAIPLLLAAADERLGAFLPAAQGYGSYRRGRTGSLATLAEQRLAAIRPATLRAQARTLASAPLSDDALADPDLVAVLPLVRTASDAATYAESAAVSALVGRYLASRGWAVVDDMLLRMLLAEMALDPAALADLSVGIELARRLGAGRIVQGSARRVSLTSTEWDVTVVTIEGPRSVRVDHIGIATGPGATPAMQQRLSTLVRAVLERRNLERRSPNEAIGDASTLSSDALGAFGAGLLALDRGETEAALAALSDAQAADPSFAEAAVLRSSVQAATLAPSLDSLIHEAARVGELQRSVLALRGAPGSVHQGAVSRVGEGERPLVTDLLGLDGLGGGVLLDVTFTLPGGTP